MDPLTKKIKNKTARIAIIGQGYVGLPLALLINQAGFFVYGIDQDTAKIKKLKQNTSYIDDISRDQIAAALKTKKFKPTTSFNILKQADVIIIAVPTPLDKYHVPDLSYIISATRQIAKRLRSQQLIILESTTYPGTTEEIVLPILADAINQKTNTGPNPNDQSAESADYPLFLAFSPERVDPGNKKFNIKNTPKVIGGVTKQSTRIANLFYSQVILQTVPVANAKTAEMSKLLENIFRAVNISLVNELALLCDKMNVDIWEVIKAASSKPFGFMPFYPGPGIGGHCIAVDPFYLSFKAREYGFFTRFIDLAGEINELMPHHIITKVATALNYSQAKAIKGTKILIIGVAYKKDIQDTRESAALKITTILHHKGARLSYFDPYINKLPIPPSNPPNRRTNYLVPKIDKLDKKTLQKFDLVLILTDHSNIDYEQLPRRAKVIVDTRNAIKSREFKNVYRL